MKPLNSAELLRNRVKEAVRNRGQRRALMRAMGLKSQGTITQWLDYAEHSPAIDKLDSIAAFLGVGVSDLFSVQESTAVTGSVHRTDPQSPSSKVSTGGDDGTAATEVSALRYQLSELQAELAARAEIIRGFADELAVLGRPSRTVPATRTHKPKGRKGA